MPPVSIRLKSAENASINSGWIDAPHRLSTKLNTLEFTSFPEAHPGAKAGHPGVIDFLGRSTRRHVYGAPCRNLMRSRSKICAFARGDYHCCEADCQQAGSYRAAVSNRFLLLRCRWSATGRNLHGRQPSPCSILERLHLRPSAAEGEPTDRASLWPTRW